MQWMDLVRKCINKPKRVRTRGLWRIAWSSTGAEACKASHGWQKNFSLCVVQLKRPFSMGFEQLLANKVPTNDVTWPDLLAPFPGWPVTPTGRKFVACLFVYGSSLISWEFNRSEIVANILPSQQTCVSQQPPWPLHALQSLNISQGWAARALLLQVQGPWQHPRDSLRPRHVREGFGSISL